MKAHGGLYLAVLWAWGLLFWLFQGDLNVSSGPSL